MAERVVSIHQTRPQCNRGGPQDRPETGRRGSLSGRDLVEGMGGCGGAGRDPSARAFYGGCCAFSGVPVRGRARLLLASALLLATPSCGREDGLGQDAMPAARPPLHLVVSGSDREMGLAHGKALAREIAEETGPRLRARLR